MTDQSAGFRAIDGDRQRCIAFRDDPRPSLAIGTA
jgi:hypothetical protein